MFLRHILYWKQTRILPNSAFKFSKLRFILRILTSRTLSFSKYCVLRRYGVTSFGLKYEVWKLDLVISSKKFVPGSLSSNLCLKQQCLKLYQTKLKLTLGYWSLIPQVSYTEPLQTFPIVESLLLVQITAFLILLYAHYNPHLRKEYVWIGVYLKM